jgi:hypothetical protein
MPPKRREYAPLAFIVARFVAAGLLFWAAAQPSMQHSFILRVALCAIGVWGIVRAFNEDAEWFLLLFYFIFALGFNPFLTLHYEQITWTIIDIITGILFLLSIFLLDSGPFAPIVDGPHRKLFVALISVAFGISWILFGGFVLYESIRPLVRTAKIKMNGVETQARITRVTHQYEARDDGNGGVNYYDVYVTNFVFSTEDGLLIDGIAELSENPASTLSVDEFREKYPEGRVIEEGHVVPLGVEYEKSNPANYRAFDNRHGIFSMILQFVVWVAIGAAFLVAGYFVCAENRRRLVVSNQ